MYAAWKSGATSPIENKPVVSDLPVLILTGDNDPITPPAWAKRAAETLSHAQYLEFPGLGHGVLGNGMDNGICSKSVFEAFLENPGIPVDLAVLLI